MKKRHVKLHNPFKTRIIDEKQLREHLALQRTKLANERTLLSYIKASLYLLIGGIALLQIKEYQGIDVTWIGYIAFFFCVLFMVVGISRYIALERRLEKLLKPNNSFYPENSDNQQKD
ncbi:hypothetical protein C7S20_09440 [Christiangramia fulva]|uniref:DUF202 domain-containing protein n=1 Tax=Christiangramia fulva TaxID=2126553 RepID=A0A2R3ZAY4_9FLAO|nr:DUF202 domain-containing protein [Christiangramia fulva]AVR47400.1 hypothetical protein C7S20_09440 [Christiangramia fulva]